MFNLHDRVRTSSGAEGFVIQFNHDTGWIKIRWEDNGDASWMPRTFLRKVE